MSYLRRFLRRPVPSPSEEPLRLHIGCGRESLQGWVNIDNQQLPGVDRVLDIRDGLPFRDAQAIFAEHFLEHLTLDEALLFLRDCRRSLADEGILRLSTPNLDWVYLTNYRVDPSRTDLDGTQLCLNFNRAFHGWGHRFLFNAPMLSAALRSVGFATLRYCRYGESAVPFLSNLERHEKSHDVPELPHVLVVEATGRSKRVPLPEQLLQEYRVALSSR
jgi:predicted SAM-dependent methyltransferase